MPRLTAGVQMPDFHFVTPFQTNRTIGETVKRVKGETAVVFLRHFGCILCQYDMQAFVRQYEDIADTGSQLLVILQSDPKKLAKELEPDTVPFEIICDPEQRLYRAFEIVSAKSKVKMADVKTLKKL